MTGGEAKTKPKRLSIVGFCADSRDWVPYEDPDMAVWGLNRGYIFMPRATAWYDMHSPAIYASQQRRPGDHLGWLKQFPGPVYSHKPIEGVPNSVEYPLATVSEAVMGNVYRVNAKGEQKRAVDEPYLTSSIAQEIALAIAEGYEEIHLYGVDLNTESEYAWQKPGVEYMLGVASGRGIKVVLPDNCPLLQGTIYGRGFLAEKGEHLSMEQLEIRAKNLTHERATVTQQLHELIGAKRELEFIQSQMVPGLDHERLDQRRHKMDEAIAQFQGRLLQIEGGIKETTYWIHQTPAGQDPKEAVEQVAARANGHANGHANGQAKPDAEGPVTEYEVLTWPEAIAQAEAPALVPA